jgi:hypothetical protein
MTTLWKSLGDRELAERELIRLRHNYGSTYELRERDAND